MNRFRSRSSAVVCAVFTCVIGACGTDGTKALVESFRPAEACTFTAGGSRWARDGGTYREMARVGEDDETWFVNIWGIFSAPEGLYVFDVGNARVARFTADLGYIGKFGREGEGPGEFPRLRVSLPERLRRIHGDGDRIVVYDGNRVSLFDSEGRYLGNLITDPFAVGLGYRTSSVRLTSAGLVFPSGGTDVFHLSREWTDSAAFRINLWSSAGIDTVAEVQAARPPRDRLGVQFTGPDQALPLWDSERGCVVISDGASPWLVVASLDGTKADTLRIELPDRRPPGYDRKELAELSARAGGGRDMPEPTATKRVRDLILDPDGHVWLLPIQPEPALAEGVEILRVDLGTGRTLVDTVPAFPAAFGEPGAYYASLRAALDQHLVVRYDRDVVGGRAGMIVQ